MRFYRRELARSRSSVRKLAAIRNALSQLEGQTDIFELVGRTYSPSKSRGSRWSYSDRYLKPSSETAQLAALKAQGTIPEEQAQREPQAGATAAYATQSCSEELPDVQALYGAVYTDEAGEHDGSEEETALELLDMMLQHDHSVVVDSIRRSCKRTKIMVQHMDNMLDLYRVHCEQSGNDASQRGYRIICGLYLGDVPSTVEQIAGKSTSTSGKAGLAVPCIGVFYHSGLSLTSLESRPIEGKS